LKYFIYLINLFNHFIFLQISLLIEEIARLRTAIQALQESHNVQIRRLEENLDEKRQHILRLENRLTDRDLEDMKKEER
jgi:homeobox protein cut-like